jgi:putative Holliday junction resolvase
LDVQQHPDIEDLAQSLPPRAPLLGLDLGTRTIGVAISDITRRIASPLTTIARQRFKADAGRILAIAEQEKAAAIILGLPLLMNGEEGRRAQATRAFARNLARLTPLPIGFWDERLSTAAVERLMIDADRSRAQRAREIDRLAATYILQGALDYLSGRYGRR